MASVRVFLSYAHDSPEHSADVRTLWTLLRERGIDARLDLPAAERRTDWPAWMRRQIDRADFVLVIASPEYRRTADGLAERHERRGVRFEAMELVEELYRDHESGTRKIVPVVLPGRTRDDVPRFLRPYSTTYVEVGELSGVGVERLLRLLTDQPSVVGVELGEPPAFGPRLPVATPVPGTPVPGTPTAAPRRVWVGAGLAAAVAAGAWVYAAVIAPDVDGSKAPGSGVPVVIRFEAPVDGEPLASADRAVGTVTGPPGVRLWAVEETADERFHPRGRCAVKETRWECPAFTPRTPVGGKFEYHVVAVDDAADEALSRVGPRGLLRLPVVTADRFMDDVINAG
ncbi:toll/interleukin-1 receptor domain-containing protein [Cryptosporangium arvum]|uniref:toll/interleukin-1 receptor domain-containing protein n=1 Tax=Cryptosporangium arvum TaxID=80871 RepID=UPI000684F3E5|nr:toll/interleukin-1 receptor domain-containing protein [Cryptosporangium arvum]